MLCVDRYSTELPLWRRIAETLLCDVCALSGGEYGQSGGRKSYFEHGRWRLLRRQKVHEVCSSVVVCRTLFFFCLLLLQVVCLAGSCDRFVMSCTSVDNHCRQQFLLSRSTCGHWKTKLLVNAVFWITIVIIELTYNNNSNNNNTKFIKRHNAVRRLQRRWRNR